MVGDNSPCRLSGAILGKSRQGLLSPTLCSLHIVHVERFVPKPLISMDPIMTAYCVVERLFVDNKGNQKGLPSTSLSTSSISLSMELTVLLRSWVSWCTDWGMSGVIGRGAYWVYIYRGIGSKQLWMSWK